MATDRVYSHAPEIESGKDLLLRAVFPLATPGSAGSGGILTVVLLTDNHSRSVEEQITTIGVLLACLSVHVLAL